MEIWPQIVVIVLYSLSTLKPLINGQETEKGIKFVSMLIAQLIMAGILYAGGFWDVLLK